MTNIPDEPERVQPDKNWEHYNLFQKIKSALFSLPIHFETDTYIEGISATDIFTLNTALGATIEDQVVNTLNQKRSIWDPTGDYSLFSFKRQSQTFPDVLLKGQKDENTEEIIMDDFVAKAKQQPLCGIPAEFWLHFFKIFVEQRDDRIIKDQIEKLRKKAEAIKEEEQTEKKANLLNILDSIENLMVYLY